MGGPDMAPQPPQRSEHPGEAVALLDGEARARTAVTPAAPIAPAEPALEPGQSNTSLATPDRKSTRLNSSHLVISYAVFCLKKKKKKRTNTWLQTRRCHNNHVQRF